MNLNLILLSIEATKHDPKLLRIILEKPLLFRLPFDLFDDMDVVTFLYTDSYLAQNHPYHFQHWQEEQFYCTPCVK